MWRETAGLIGFTARVAACYLGWGRPIFSGSNHGRTDTPVFCRCGGDCCVFLWQRDGAKCLACRQAGRPQGLRSGLVFHRWQTGKGSSEFTFAFDDTTYWFTSAEHRALFAADPEHYAPQFDGYCAIQVSRGLKLEADPEAWTITNGKLYVFSAKPGVPMFQEQPVAIAEKARENWPKLRAAQ